MRVRNAQPSDVLTSDVLTDVERRVWELCTRLAPRLQFHGWHHVSFVRDKAVHFAERNGSSVDVVHVAALVHDVNYVVRRNSPASEGSDLRQEILAEAGVDLGTAEWIDRIVDEAEMRTRHRDISLEAQALSDADTLFKALPVTPVVLAHKYLLENGITLDRGTSGDACRGREPDAATPSSDCNLMRLGATNPAHISEASTRTRVRITNMILLRRACPSEQGMILRPDVNRFARAYSADGTVYR